MVSERLAPMPENALLRALPGRERRLMVAACTPVELVFAEVLEHQGERLRYVHFPTASSVSLLAKVSDGGRLEVAMIGNEGMLGYSLALGVEHAAVDAVVQGAGAALRMQASVFLRHYRASAALRRLLGRYLYVLMGQFAQAAACARFHVLEARLARWLLMTQDRAHSEHLRVTQVFLAYMLGVRRVGVTHAASALQDQGLITYRRGHIAVLDRVGLEAAACGCYASDVAAVLAVFGKSPPTGAGLGGVG